MKKTLLVLLAVLLLIPPVLASSAHLEVSATVPDSTVLAGDSTDLRVTFENTGTNSATAITYEIIADSVFSGYQTGQIGLGQRFCELISHTWSSKSSSKSAIETAKDFSRLAIQDFGSTFINTRL